MSVNNLVLVDVIKLYFNSIELTILQLELLYILPKFNVHIATLFRYIYISMC